MTSALLLAHCIMFRIKHPKLTNLMVRISKCWETKCRKDQTDTVDSFEFHYFVFSVTLFSFYTFFFSLSLPPKLLPLFHHLTFSSPISPFVSLLSSLLSSPFFFFFPPLPSHHFFSPHLSDNRRPSAPQLLSQLKDEEHSAVYHLSRVHLRCL